MAQVIQHPPNKCKAEFKLKYHTYKRIFTCISDICGNTEKRLPKAIVMIYNMALLCSYIFYYYTVY
jgi:hypothetical protein